MADERPAERPLRARLSRLSAGAPSAPVSLLFAAVVLVAFGLWSWTTAWGLTVHLLDETPAVDVLALDPAAPVPPEAVAGSYVGPIEDPGGLWQFGHQVDAWTRTGRSTREVPRARFVMRGRVWLPAAGPWSISGHAAPPNEQGYAVRMWIDGQPIADEPRTLAAGWHDIQYAATHVHYISSTPRLKHPSRGAIALPERWLRPEGGAPWTAPVLLGLAAACLVAGGVWLARDPAARSTARGEARRWAPVLVVVLAIIGGTALRAHGRLAAPRVGHTWDEYQEAWQGTSLMHGEKPIAWGFPPWQPAYGRDFAVAKFFGRDLMIVRPYTEHPPLFAVLVGAAARFEGIRDPFRVPLSTIRRVPLLLSILFYPLLYAITRRAFGRWPAALACVLFAVAPPFVLVMRFAKGDLLAALMGLVTVWTGLRAREAEPSTGSGRGPSGWVIACGVAAGLGFWAKELGIYTLVLPALVLSPVGMMNVAGRERWRVLAEKLRPAAIATGIALAVLASYAVYGWAVGWQRFVTFLKIQGMSRIGQFDAAADFATTLYLNWAKQQLVPFHAGWLLLWFGAAWAAARLAEPTPAGPRDGSQDGGETDVELAGELDGQLDPRSAPAARRVVAALPFLFLAVLVLAVDARWHYGWYQLPLYAPLAAVGGALLWDAVRRAGVASAFAVLLLGALPLVAVAFAIPEPERMSLLRRLVVVVAFPIGLAAVVETPVTRTLARIAAGTAVAAFLALCIVASWRIAALYAAAG